MKQDSTRYQSHKSVKKSQDVPLEAASHIVKSETTLICFLSALFPQKTNTALKNMIQHRCVYVNDQVVTRAVHLLSAGDVVKTVSAKQQRFGLHHPDLSLIYEDDAILVVNKGSGLHSVDSTHGGIENAAGILESYLCLKHGDRRIYVVHRLDRDTSGVMIFAKTRVAQDRLVKTWQDSVLERKYVAVAEGCLSLDRGTIDTYLYEDSRKIMRVTEDAKLGLRAVTHYEVVRRGERYTKVYLELETGRTNQIRVHLQALGHPIAGDLKYRASSDPIGRLALHALNIRFLHPMTRRVMTFSAPEPTSFDRLF